MLTRLKTFRTVVAAMVFVVITLLFMGVNFTDNLSALLLKLQFVPAMLSFLQGSIIAFILLLIITLLFGRVYCSFICPTGILQDFVGKCSDLFRKKVLKHKIKSSYHKPHNILRYSILIIVALFFIAGITAPLIFLDPYSNFGTIASQVFGSIIYHPYIKFSFTGFSWALIFLLMLIIFSAFKGRLYCNTICPVGTILGLISGFSLFKPVIKKEMCVKCTACARVCKSNCIDMESKEIDSTRCVACYNCIPSCKRGGVTIAPIWFNKGKDVEIKHDLESKERRNALIAMGAFGSALALRGIESKYKIISKEEDIKKESYPILPPGAGDLKRFKANCTSCHACVAVCPQNIIKPSITQFGLDGFMIPYLDLKGSFCDYTCNKCSQTCPNSAILPLSLPRKQQTQIAKTKYIAKQCIVFSRDKNCGRCAKKCPVRAIEMTEVKGKQGLFFPKFIKEKCIGCGACVVVCPPKTKAIEVVGISEQNIIT